MSTAFTVYIIIQFLVSVALIYGYMHEKQVIAFEDKLWSKIKATVRRGKMDGPAEKKQEENDLALVHDPTYHPYSCYNHVA